MFEAQFCKLLRNSEVQPKFILSNKKITRRTTGARGCEF